MTQTTAHRPPASDTPPETDPFRYGWRLVPRPTASSRDIFGCSKNRQNRIVENSTYPLDDFGFR